MHEALSFSYPSNYIVGSFILLVQMTVRCYIYLALYHNVGHNKKTSFVA
jgi:hypothetical protein